jgi:hypothetical protein
MATGVEAAFGWIGTIFDSLIKLAPHLQLIVKTERGVKLTRTNKSHLLGPGLHLYHPLLSEIVKYSVVDEVYHIGEVACMYGGHPYTFSGFAIYQIVDPELLATTLGDEEHHQLVRNEVRTAMVRVLTRLGADDMEAVEASARLKANFKTGKYGVFIRRVAFQDIVRTKAHQHYGIQMNTSVGDMSDG